MIYFVFVQLNSKRLLLGANGGDLNLLEDGDTIVDILKRHGLDTKSVEYIQEDMWKFARESEVRLRFQ